MRFFPIFLVACFSPQVPDGKLHCAADRGCPDGYTCAADDTCWRHPPAAMDLGHADLTARPDLGPAPDMSLPPRTAHRGVIAPAGAVQAQSQHFQVRMVLGAPPGGNAPAASASFKVRPGLVGATQ